MKLLPEKMMPFLKSWVALAGVILVALASAWTAAPGWVTIAAAVVTAVGVYLVPNAPAKEKEHDDSLRA